MKKYLLTGIYIIMILVCSVAQESAYPTLPFTNLSLIAVSGDNIFAVGSCSNAQISTDGGANWDIFEISDNGYMIDLKIIPGGNGEQSYLLNKDELYLFDIDQTLIELNTQAIDLYGRFLGMEIDNEYIYIISEGAINRAPHGTLAWEFVTEVIYDTSYIISATSSSLTNIYVANRDGQVFQTNKNTGGYDEIVNLGSHIQKIDMANDQVGYLTMTGESGPLKTIDGGTTWIPVSNWPENNPVYVYNEDIFLTSNTNRYFVSLDGGATVTDYEMNDDVQAGLIERALFLEDGTLYMVGGSSTVLRSNDFGSSYENLLPFNRSDLYNIDLTSTTGIASGYQSIILTEDGGNTWTPYTNNDINQVNDAVVIGENKYAIATEDGVVILSNGIIESTAGANAYRIHSAADNTYLLAGMRIGNSHVISKSVDGGLSWSNKVFNDDYLGRIKINTEGIIYVISGDGKYLKSDDDGDSWEEVELPISGFFLDMVLEQGISLFSLGGTLYESIDGMTNLDMIASGYLLDNIHILDEDHYTYSTGGNSNTTIYEKKPADNNFSLVERWCGTSRGSYNNNSVVWYAKRGGHMNTYDFDLTTSTVDISNSEINMYPNPITVGERLFINNISDRTEIRILDNIGRSIISVSTETENTEIETNTLNAGNYYISISNSKSSITSKLMVF